MKDNIFELSEEFISNYRNKQPKWGPLGYITYKRTYSRPLPDGTSENYWQTVKRVVEGVFTIQKDHCKRNSLPFNHWKAQASAQKMFKLMWEFKFTPPGRGLWMMGTDYMYKRGGAALNNPLGLDTKILTKEYGWTTLGELDTNRKITVLSNTKLYGRDNTTNAQPKWAEATVSEIEEQPTKKITFQDKFGNTTTITASNNHRWFRRRMKTNWERVTTEDLKIGDYLPMTKPSKNYKLSLQGAQHGFFFGDGTRNNGELHQFDKSIDVLKELFTNVVDIDKRHSVVRQCPLAWGKVPIGWEYKDDVRYMYGFLSGYLAADGHVDKKGNVNISSSRMDELEEVSEFFSVLGIRTSAIRIQSTWSNFSKARKLYSLGINPIDLDAQFFLKKEHLKRWKENYSKTKRDWCKVVDISENGIKSVRCVTVPKYEQFVIDGFCLTSNCAFTSTENINVDFAEPFVFLMDMSMLGVGVGGDTKGAGKVTIKEPKVDGPHVVEDTREGWNVILKRVLNSFVGKDTMPSEIDYSLVRPLGAPIKGFGGVASGPEPLIELVRTVTELLTKRIGQTITSSDIVDIFNMVGKCVVSGNVRRSAEIMFGELEDKEFMELKDPEKNKEALMSHRWACLTGDTQIHTEKGCSSIKDLVGKKDFNIILDGQRHLVNGVKYTGDKQVYKIETISGQSITGSDNHQLMTSDGWKTIKDIKKDDRLIISNNNRREIIKNRSYELGYLIGHLIGDGTFTTTSTTGTDIARLQIYKKDNGFDSMKDYIESIFNFKTRSDFNGFSKLNKSSNDVDWAFISCKEFTDIVSQYKIKKGNKQITKELEEQSDNMVAGVASGLFDTDGWFNIERRTFSIEQSNKQTIYGLQRILLRLGIKSNVNKLKRLTDKPIQNGKKVNRKQAYRLTICGYDNSEKFVDKCGIHHSEKLEKWNVTKKVISKPKYENCFVVKSKTKKGIEKTYDMNVPFVNAFSANGFYVHNSNNSIFAKVGMDYSEVAKLTAKNGEPGFMWLDNAQKYSRMNGVIDNKDYRAKGGNPSLRAGTKILTKKGIFNIEDLQDKDIIVKNLNGKWSKAKCFLSGENKQLYELELNGGKKIWATPEHKWAILEKDGVVKHETSALKKGMKLPIGMNDVLDINGDTDITKEDGFMIGWLTGDGWITSREDDKRREYGFIFNLDELESANRIVKHVNSLKSSISTLNPMGKSNVGFQVSNRDFDSLMRTKYKTVLNKEEGISKGIWKSNDKYIKGFIEGLFSADGDVSKHNICLTTSREKIASDMCKLLSFYGIKSDVSHRQRTGNFPNGKDYEKLYDSYRVRICGRYAVRFSKLFTLTKKKQDKADLLSVNLKYADSRHFDTIKSVKLSNIKEDVWDITVYDDTHCFQCDYVITGNCLEQTLEPYELCCVTGDTRIQTLYDAPKIKDVVDSEKSVFVYNGKDWSWVKPFFTGNRDIYRVTISDGSYLDVTDNHEWSVKKPTERTFKKKTTMDLEPGMYLPEFELSTDEHSTNEATNSYAVGWFTGDGFMDKNRPMSVVQQNEYDVVLPLLDGKEYKEQHPKGYTRPFKRVSMKNTIDVDLGKKLRDHSTGLPDEIFTYSTNMLKDFFGGWIDSDGSLRKHANTDAYLLNGTEANLRDAQLLLRKIGVNHSTIYETSPEGFKTNLGVRNHALWSLYIPTYEADKINTKLKIACRIGSRFKKNNAHLFSKKIDSARKQKIVSIEKLKEKQDTYCFTEPKKHMGVFGNVLTHQCLVETYPGKHETLEEWHETLKYAYLYAKTVTLVPTHNKLTNAVMLRNRRIGCSMSGIVQAFKKFSRRGLFEGCDKGYDIIQKYDEVYSDWLCVPRSIKTTSVKPSGTVSLLAGVTPGIHYPVSEYYIRNVRFQEGSKLLEELRIAGYKIEKDKYSLNTYVVSFPVKEEFFDRSVKDVSMWEQLENAAQIQSHWADNQVSVTVTFSEDEAKDIKYALELYETRLKGVSFLPKKDHGYEQAPYIPISKEDYDIMTDNLKKIKKIKGNTHEIDEKFCDSDTCQI